MLYFRDRKKRCKRLTRQLTRKCSGFYLSQGAASSVIRSFSQAPSSVLATGHRSPRRWCRSFPAGASPSSSTTSAEALRLLERSLAIDLSFRNPNQVGFKFQNSSALLDYRGNDISEAPIPAGQIHAGETLTLTVMADRQVYEEYLDDPVIKGKKNELEKFVGGYYTTSVEAFIPNTGRGIQRATSHYLGQNFAKMFDITFENDKGEKAMVWQNSWAYSTRTIGVMVMVHGDDKGLVLPPKVAVVQVIVVPVPFKDADTQAIFDACTSTVESLSETCIRVEADLRDNYSPGWKYSNWEMKGVPLRIEIGPKDLAKSQVRVVRRDNSDKVDIPMSDLVGQVKDILAKIQQILLDVAITKRDACIKVVKTWDEFAEALAQKKLILAPWCDEERLKKMSRRERRVRWVQQRHCVYRLNSPRWRKVPTTLRMFICVDSLNSFPRLRVDMKSSYSR